MKKKVSPLLSPSSAPIPRSAYDYGKCEVCGAKLQEKRVSQDFRIRGKLIVVENVPAGVCPRCGEKVVKSEVGARIMELIGSPGKLATAHQISVPSIRYETEEESLTRT